MIVLLKYTSHTGLFLRGCCWSVGFWVEPDRNLNSVIRPFLCLWTDVNYWWILLTWSCKFNCGYICRRCFGPSGWRVGILLVYLLNEFFLVWCWRLIVLHKLIFAVENSSHSALVCLGNVAYLLGASNVNRIWTSDGSWDLWLSLALRSHRSHYFGPEYLFLLLL